ncbi:NAD(P)H-quinone oxidoreductase [Corynebacterium sp. TAE3-ERU30]|uniref:NAD(P)H-quinone oxidoreductase n=1 Tax=Corynebacterium sp. TAE3-ERU30 TaxID=2849496 RepID=UPI001C44FC25|nr:NAD(P)H-quinone oxidoreductase [Corynebacterium sp. TAE3-ERU30]MBV7282240.1 NAD(P)H-quinone oxidoreductase [Corynebacterium sp. TAE3-ERU30]
MKAITLVESDNPKRPDLVWDEVERPSLAAGEVLVEVKAAGVNRADLAQRAGAYPPPEGASEILGLEIAGVVADPGDSDYAVGDKVCALLAGGGYAEYAAVPAGQLLPVPEGWSFTEAASIVEVATTVWSNIVMTAHLEKGQTLLVHGGGGGIGTFAIQLGKALGCTVAGTAGSAEKVELMTQLGADVAINYKEQDFAEVMRNKCNVILDVVGGSYLDSNVKALAMDGTVTIIGLIGGPKGELNVGRLLSKRGTLAATTLRNRSTEDKAEIVRQTQQGVWPLLESGEISQQISTVLPITEAAEAHRIMAKGEMTGKIILEIS